MSESSESKAIVFNEHNWLKLSIYIFANCLKALFKSEKHENKSSQSQLLGTGKNNPIKDFTIFVI